jgi:hypothetical protein
MNREKATNLMTFGFFCLLCIVFFCAYHFSTKTVDSVATLDYDINVTVLAENKTAEPIAGAAVTGELSPPQDNKTRSYMEKPIQPLVFWLQIVAVFSLLAVYGVYRGGFLKKQYSNESIKGYLAAGIEKGYSAGDLRKELLRQKIPEEQINQVMQEMGKV